MLMVGKTSMFLRLPILRKPIRFLYHLGNELKMKLSVNVRATNSVEGVDTNEKPLTWYVAGLN